MHWCSPAEYEAYFRWDKAPKDFWRTQDGRELYIPEMEDAHLRNAMALFMSRGLSWHPKVGELVQERRRRLRTCTGKVSSRCPGSR